jgi:spermidine synthase
VRYLKPSGTTALSIGLGTGEVPRLLGAAGIQTDVVEIDPNIVQAATDFFGFKPNGKVYVEDGRQFLNNSNRKYDFIVHDTFTGGAVPFHLLSRQVFQATRRILAEDGVFCLVFVGYFSGEKALPARALFATLSSVYPHVRVIADPHDPTQAANLLFFASTKPLDWRPAQWTDLSKRTRERLETQQVIFPSPGNTLITDELNPLDLWQADKQASYRAWILQQFPSELLID